jgi:hypothetical protein
LLQNFNQDDYANSKDRGVKLHYDFQHLQLIDKAIMLYQIQLELVSLLVHIKDQDLQVLVYLLRHKLFYNNLLLVVYLWYNQTLKN